jgi:hypothetical protein
MEFEKEFDIQIPDDQAENIATVGQAISYIEEAKNNTHTYFIVCGLLFLKLWIQIEIQSKDIYILIPTSFVTRLQ